MLELSHYYYVAMLHLFFWTVGLCALYLMVWAFINLMETFFCSLSEKQEHEIN